MHVALLCVRLLLAGVFALASVAKLADLRGSRTAVMGFGVSERVAPSLGTLLPLAELAVAVALLPAATARVGALGAVVLLSVFIAAIARSMARGEAPDCHCFGQLHSAPAGRRALARNLALAALAAFVAAAGWSNAGPSATAWTGRLSDAGAVALAAGLAIGALAALTVWGLLGLLRQNGRILLRIEELEARIDPNAALPPTAAAAPAPAPGAAHPGLPLGDPAPAFSLAGLYGETVTLESLISADTPVMLLFTDPKCGPCNALMPQIATWQHDLAGELTIAVLTRGSPRDNRAKIREHGIVSVWLDDGLTVYEAYAANGTPGAVLIDGRGRIASVVVAGADAIADLVAQATRPAAVPVVPMAVGDPAPALALSDLTGEPVALADPDRDTLVLFWNPGCGFCARMLDDVREFERSAPPGAPRLLVISTGSVADNERLGLSSPIALDNAFAAGTAFGSTGTPSAVLIDRHGTIASELALGAPQVMALATAASPQGA